MPPSIDVYVLTARRDRDTVEAFLDGFVDRRASEDRGDEELMIVPSNVAYEHIERLQDWDWEPAKSLGHIVQRGLDTPPRGFTVYLKPADPQFDGAILTFTIDGHLVLGLSIDDAGAQPQNLERAKDVLHTLASRFEGQRGVIVVEQPPPLHELGFDRGYDPVFVLYHWRRPGSGEPHDKRRISGAA